MSRDLYVFRERFTRYPGGRYRAHGPYSGEQFLDDVLLPRFEAKQETTLDLTGAIGFASSFLDASFGEFAARLGIHAFDLYFEIQTDRAALREEIRECMERGAKSTKR